MNRATQVELLDDYARYFEDGVALLKIDAEGHQYDVISGGEQVGAIDASYRFESTRSLP